MPVFVAIRAATGQSENIAMGQRVKGLPNPNPPITIRMTPALVEALDLLAAAQHRKRANLVQHVLWDYVFAQKAATAAAKPSSAKTVAGRADGKTGRRPKKGAD
jgi:predicted transcriptional regulator